MRLIRCTCITVQRSTQRLSIAQAVVRQPRILLDEPFGAFDPGIRANMHGLIRALWQEKQMMVFMVMHDLKELRTRHTHLTFDKMRRDPQAPEAYGTTITYDVPLVKPPQPTQKTTQQKKNQQTQTKTKTHHHNKQQKTPSAV